MYVPICNRFHIIRANNGKMTSFLGGYPSSTPSFEGNPCTQWLKFRHDKLETWRTHSEDFVILACTVLIQITSVTDERTDRQTDRQTPRRWQRRAKHSAVARNKHTFT